MSVAPANCARVSTARKKVAPVQSAAARLARSSLARLKSRSLKSRPARSHSAQFLLVPARKASTSAALIGVAHVAATPANTTAASQYRPGRSSIHSLPACCIVDYRDRHRRSTGHSPLLHLESRRPAIRADRRQGLDPSSDMPYVAASVVRRTTGQLAVAQNNLRSSRRKRMKLTASAASILLLLGAAASAQTLDDLKKDGNGGSTDNILTYGMGYQQTPFQSAQAGQQADHQAAGAGLEPQPRQQLGRAGAADRLQRRDVRDQRARHRGDRRRDRQADLEADARLAARDAARGLLRRLEQGRGDLRRQGLPHHARRVRRGLRCQDRQGGLEDQGRRMEGRHFADAGAAGRERCPGDRQLRRRVRRARLHRRLRHRDRQAALAALHHSGERREGQRDLAAGQQRLGVGRRLGLDHRLLRSRPRPHVLGHRQPGAVGVAVAAGRQPLHLVGAGDAAEDRRDRLALPVHAERRLRLRRLLGADHRRQGHRRREAQSDHAAQPQRLPLRDRPHQRPSCSPPTRSRK